MDRKGYPITANYQPFSKDKSFSGVWQNEMSCSGNELS